MANDPPVSGPPIFLAPETYQRHDQAVRYVEEIIRTRAPRPGRSRFPGLAPGAWGLLASGHSISAATGLALGSGSVNLCDRSGTDSGVTVPVYNAGGFFTGPAVIPLEWTVGVWSVCGCFSACTITGTVWNCDHTAVLTGAPITLTQSGTTIVSTTSDGSGNFSVTVPANGTYQLTVTKTGFFQWAKQYVITCPMSIVQDVKLASSTAQGVVIGTSLCGGAPLPMIAPVLTIAGATYGPDALMQFNMSLDPGSYSYTITGNRINPFTGSFTVVSTCTRVTPAGATLVPASGYHCASCIGQPLADTLHGTDNVYGTITLTYNTTNHDWEGSKTVSTAAACGCGAASGVTLFYQYLGAGTDAVKWTVGFSPPCPGAASLGQGSSGAFAVGHARTCGPAFVDVVTFPACSSAFAQNVPYPFGTTPTLTVTE